MLKAIKRLKHLKWMPISVQEKEKIIRANIIPLALYGSEAASVNEAVFQQLRATIAEVIGPRSAKTCNDLVFVFTDSAKDLDPSAHLLYNRVSAIRRVVTKYKGYHAYVTCLLHEFDGVKDSAKSIIGPISMLAMQFKDLGYGFGSMLTLHKNNEPNLDLFEHPWQHLKTALFEIIARNRVVHINKTRTFHNHIPEIDQGIVKEVLHKLGSHERNVYRCLGTGATWDQKQLSEVLTTEHTDKCAHCGSNVESHEHILWDCEVINSHRKCREMCSLDHQKLPICIKVGLPVAMHAKFDQPFWGSNMQPDGGVAEGVGAPLNREMYGAQCENNILIKELEANNLGPQIRDCNARQAFMSLKQNLDSPHIVLPYHCVFIAPDIINVYTDGSWINPQKFHFALGGAGVWWPTRTLVSKPMSTAELELTQHIICSNGIRVFAAIGGFSGSSTRNELAAGIIAMCAYGPVHLASDSKVFVDKANEIVKNLTKNPDDKTNYSTWSDGDLWMYFVKVVQNKGLQSVRFTWVKGHATDEHVAQGITTNRNKRGNEDADACADMGVMCHGEGMNYLANAYSKRHGQYAA